MSCVMNTILLETEDFFATDRVRLLGRRLRHVREIHQAAEGDELRVGVLNGKLGCGRVERIDQHSLELSVRLDLIPPPPLPLHLILALPRPKVLNRSIAAAASMGIKQIDLINAWRVEKAYWDSPKLSEQNLREQLIFGLEQSGDTILPTIRLQRLFVPFVREELPKEISGRLALLAHPTAEREAPRCLTGPVVLAIGPEGGFIEREANTFQEIGFEAISLGRRILRVETALAFLIGRLF